MTTRPIIVLLLLVGGIYAQSPAASFVPSSELNKHLPSWVRLSGEYRARLEGSSGGAFRDDSEDAYLLNRFRINLKLLPSPWLKFVFQGQDARVFWNDRIGNVPPYHDTMDLRLAFVEFGDAENKPLSLRVGRQELAFGEQRLVGNLNWANTSRTFDAVRATFRHRGYRLDAFASSVVVARNGEFNRHTDGNNLHGLYGGIEKLVPNAVVEPYVLWRLAPGIRAEDGALARLDFKTIGVRWVGRLPRRFDYGFETAIQAGSLGSDTVRAWAGHWVAGYTINGRRYKPRVFAEYNYGSGDRDPHDGRRGAFDTLYPTGHDKHGLADQVGWSNIHDLRFGAECKPRPKWQINASYHSFWLASARDGLYNAAHVIIARSPDGSAGRHVGQELDVQASYSPSQPVQIAFGYANLFPGEFLNKTTPGRAYRFPYAMLSYAF